jgi:alcohol dehydrogenase
MFPTTRLHLQVAPTRVLFGPDTAMEVPTYLKQAGATRIAVVANTRALNALSRLLAELKRDFIVTVISGVPVEPTLEEFEALRSRLAGTCVDALVACGGGSVMDTAKLIAALHDTNVSIRAALHAALPKRRVRLVCIPSTSGSGSEVSATAILLDGETQRKCAVTSDELLPDIAFVDPTLTYSAPPQLTASTGMDALVHCIEAYVNKRSTQEIDLLALDGIDLIGRFLERAVRDGQDAQARTGLALASLYGGACARHVTTAAVHALSTSLGSLFRVSHGLANSLLVAPVLRFNLPAAVERYARVAEALGASPQPGGDLATAETAIHTVERLVRRCRLPHGLRECGISSADIPRLATTGMQQRSLLENNVREVTHADALRILQAAY